MKRLLCLGIGAIAGCLLVGQPETFASIKSESFNRASNSKDVIGNTPTSVIEQEAEQLYEQGQLTAAASLLQQVINSYQAQGKVSKQILAHRNLALIYQQLGDWERAKQALSGGEALISAISEPERQRLQAQILEARGQLQLSLAQPEQALDTWKQATAIYQQIGDLTGFTQNKIYQAQALQTLGLYAQVIRTLTAVRNQLDKEPDTAIKIKAFNSLGDVLRRVGRYQQSQSVLLESLSVAEKLKATSLKANTLISLGNTARLQQEPDKALEYYQQAIAISPHLDLKLRGNLDRLSLLIATEQTETAISLISPIENLLTQLPSSQIPIQGRIDLARSLLKLDTRIEPTHISEHLVTAIKQARDLRIPRAEVAALGTLGTLYEQHQRLPEARQLTEKALLIAQGINASDEAYQWQWQLGRILNIQGEREEAIAAYIQAANNLRSLRGDLAAVGSQVQFSFRESIEPVYRELVGLLLHPEATQAELAQAREAIESLQVAELDNFFRDACLDAQPVQIDNLDPNAAIIYTIILDDRLEAIAAIPGQPLQHYTTNLLKSEIEISLISANTLISRSRRRLNLESLQQAYDWLIRPLEAKLEANKIETLVFIPDGVLRNLPPATLHDGKQYLIEKYNVAIAPSLQLIDPQPLETVEQEMLLGGLSEPRQGFPPLPGAKQEIEQIQTIFSAEEILFNESFTELNFARVADANPYRVIHLATHGKFSSQTEDTFVLTWSDRLNINELNSLIRGDKRQTRPLELLVLSACETAAGDKQAALGLAGMAVRAGARSTIASLWAVSDEATLLLMTNFYQELSQGKLTKAEALRRAQQILLQTERFSHPYFWSAFVLVGNWL